MNLLHWIVYLVRLPLYVVALVLFRIYLCLVFFTRGAAPLLFTAALAAVAWWGRSWLEPQVLELHAQWRSYPEGDPLEWAASVMASHPYPIFAVATGAVVFIGLSSIQGPLRSLLLAFPMPKRPLPPLRHWTPPPHRLKAYPVLGAVPRLPLRYLDGQLDTFAARIDPKVQALLTPSARKMPSEVQQMPKVGQGDPKWVLTSPLPREVFESTSGGTTVLERAHRAPPKATQPAKPPMPKRKDQGGPLNRN